MLCLDFHEKKSEIHFIATYSSKISLQFIASSSRRSACDKVLFKMHCSTIIKPLYETALFGCACRHEFPLMFIDLKVANNPHHYTDTLCCDRISYAELGCSIISS